MTPFPRGKRGNLSVYIPRPVGGPIERSTRTNDKKLVKSYEAAVYWLATQTPPAWDILHALIVRRITFAQCVELHAAGRGSLAPLRAKLADVDLRTTLPDFIAAWVADGRKARTLENYEREIGAYLAAHPMRSDFTEANVQAHIRSLTVSPGTRRKHLYALRAFERYLVERHVLTVRTLPNIRAPKKNTARKRYESAETDARLCAAALPKYRALFALVHATGADVGAALAMVGRDLSLASLRCRVPGTKTAHRDRHDVEIDAWAVPFLTELRTVLPAAPLFPDLTRHGAAAHHKHVGHAVQVLDYTLRDARHSIAVRWRKAGRSFEEIARQLRTSVYHVATVYADFSDESASGATNPATSAEARSLTLHTRNA